MDPANINWSFIIFLIFWFSSIAALFWVAGSNRLNSGDDFETRRLYFAAVVLSGLGLIFVFSTALYFLSAKGSEAGKEIFDAAKTIIPPIITLVLGYYFGQDKDKQNTDSKPTDIDTNADSSKKT